MSLIAVIGVRGNIRGKIGQTKVKRYWPGKAPEWADKAEEDADIRTARKEALDEVFSQTTSSRHPQIKDDPRLRRLAESRVVDSEEVRADHRRTRQVWTEEEEESRGLERAEAEEEDEDALEERRRRIREKLRLHRQQPPLLEEEEESEESEYETEDSDDDGAAGGISLVFVPKSERDTIAERERLEAEELALEEAVRRRLEERKVETKQIVVEKIREEQEIQKNTMEAEEANMEDVETDDELNEYKRWKAREIARIKRDREAREALLKIEKEVRDIFMTDEERREWERKKNSRPQGIKQKWRFMQKDYHKGAFFQADADGTAAPADPIYARDFSAPTGEDKMDKTILPKVMQVKHFGRSGRTKWTHLLDQDTTHWNNNPYIRSLSLL